MNFVVIYFRFEVQWMNLFLCFFIYNYFGKRRISSVVFNCFKRGFVYTILKAVQIKELTDLKYAELTELNGIKMGNP